MSSPTRDQLLDDIRQELARMPCIDLHSHLRWDRPQAIDLGEMVFYHFLTNEMVAAGMPHDILAIENTRDRTRAALPWLDLIRHSGTSYCLKRMLQDLYGMEEEWLDEGNFDKMWDRVAERAGDPEWPRQTLAKGRLAKVFVSSHWNWGEAFAKGNPDFVRYNDLFELALETGFQYDEGWTRPPRPQFAPMGKDVTRRPKAPRPRYRPETLDEFLTAPFRWHGEADWARTRACLGWTSTDFRWMPADRYAEETVYDKIKSRTPLDKGEIARMRLALMRALLDECRRRGVDFQIFFGSIMGPAPRPPYPPNVVYDQKTFVNFGRLAAEYEDVPMSLFLGSILNSQEAAIMTKMRRNVRCAGLWWHNMYASYVRRNLAERLDVCPLNKVALFFSDAYMSEWCYGKRMLVEREFGFMLAERVHDGYITRADASRIARMWMLENPVNWHKLNVSL